MFRLFRPLSLALVVLGLGAATPVWGQVDLVDPDVPKTSADEVDPEPPSNERPSKSDPKTDRPEVTSKSTDIPDPKGPRDPKLQKSFDVQIPADFRPSVQGFALTHATDADLEGAWQKWRVANASPDFKAEAQARAALLKLKTEVAAVDLEAFSQGMIRAALAHEQAGDSSGAIELGLAAVDLAPNVPSSWLGLSRVYMAVDPSGVGRIVAALQVALGKLVEDPRYFRPALADLLNALFTALTALAVAVVLVLFARRARYFFYDFHFLFPRVFARWQSTAIAALILLLPVVFRMGVAPALLAMFAAVAFYLTLAERVVAAALIAMLGVIPSFAALAAHHTAFAGTPAEQAYLVEKGGPGAEPLAAQLTRLAAEDKASFAQLFVLGSFELRRGKLEQAVPRLKSALLKKSNDARASTNLAVAMLLTGDLENPRSLFEDAAKAEPTLATPLFDLSRLFQRRAATFGRDATAGEVDRGSQAIVEAHLRDPKVGELKEPRPGEPIIANQFLLVAPLAKDELLGLSLMPEAEDKIRAQLRQSLIGDVPAVVAPIFPAFAALLLFGLGFLSRSLLTANPCQKCGAPVSPRGDPQLAPGSLMCTQCVNVFARKGVVPPALKVRKQLEVSRYQTRMERLSYALGLACSGMGHIFSGLVIRGTLYGFMFLLVIVLFLQRHGVMRAPYEAVPLLLRLVPLAILFVLVYLLSLRGLYKRQN